MLSQKPTRTFGRANRTCPIWLTLLVTITLVSAACALAARNGMQPLTVDPCEVSSGASKVSETKRGVVEDVCALIYQGQFDAAGELIEKSDQTVYPRLGSLAEIVREYKDLQTERQAAQEQAYKEQLAELEGLKAEIDVNDLPGKEDANDVNDIAEVLLVVLKASEFADRQQKQELLAEPFIKQVYQKAIDKAAELEAESNWLDAYTSCYYWLQAIEPNNEAYSDYVDDLVDKAAIKAAFQDSPCETRKERFEGIRKELFLRALAALNLYYVSIIDYGEMATRGIQRCRILTDVIEKFSAGNFSAQATASEDTPQGGPSEESDSSDDSEKVSFELPEPEELAGWRTALSALLDEIEQSPTGFGKSKFVGVLGQVLAKNEETAKLPAEVLIAQFSEAALSALDPYTVMVWPRQVKDFEKMMMNEFTGIGVEISRRQGLLTIASLLPDTPAYSSGLDAGDVIEAVDGMLTKDMTLMCAVHKITGPKGTKVELTIKRPGEEQRKQITIVRDKITVPTIRGWQRTEVGKWRYILDEVSRIGYVRITSFSGGTARDLDRALKELEEKGLQGLILDLRYNSGGLLDSAVAVADKFIGADGELIVKTQPGFGRVPTYATAHKKGTHPDYPLVILINSSSASASEIVAGALADAKYNRAILVGERTHGKGSVQGITRYPGGGAQLKYTMAYYHLPSGQRVESQDAMKKQGRDDWGVGPNVKVALRSDELKKMIDVQRDNDVLVKAGHDNTNHKLNKHTIEETLKADAQLAVGVMLVRTKLIEAGVSAETIVN